MLVLTRRVGESIKIGSGDDTITLTCLGVKGNQVRLGVEAPKSVAVHREEIFQRIAQGQVRPTATANAKSDTRNNSTEQA